MVFHNIIRIMINILILETTLVQLNTVLYVEATFPEKLSILNS